MKKLTLKIFRFDKDKDYESYYKPYIYSNYENFATLHDLLLQVQDDDIYFEFEKNDEAYILINQNPYQLQTPLEKILKSHGFELLIEPLSLKRAIKDLIIDKSDFLAQFEIFKSFATQKDKKEYESLAHLYYTSEILSFKADCFGDSLFYFAYKMIQKYPQKKEEILKLLSDKEKGIFYHIPSKNKELETIILNLQDEILKANLFDKNLLMPKETQLERSENLENIKHNFQGFNIGFYGFNPSLNLKKKLKARVLDFENKEKNSGYSLLKLDANTAYKMAAGILLDAYDSGCDFLVVSENKDFHMFDTEAKHLMRVSGREFGDFYILTYDEFISLLQGKRLESLKQHNLKVSL